ncbi:hypothetical protein PC9H_008292 [Pleurotus ostreatus]|uniref:MFS general substrate transporter n=1 Tax=Pleurotus ostreatus TaxID=5322 RepID=A0A8H6ZNG4_PLEOS|nr:uncharacterized protein PC9H_008292 [Pleurotus ostreatus]KAF7425930.1 hypothetical protein PC9H_008292 [Pleurotus ostreatus]
MSDIAEKAYEGSDSDVVSHPETIYERPKGLRGLYYHPVTQISMLGFVCFMCPGLFNALNGLGAGGQVDSATSANANSALYSTFAFFAFFAGSINNKLGSRLTLLIGSTGYGLYIGSYLAMNIHSNAGGFVIAAGAILGICAGLLWAAQGSLMLAYPTESEKGKYISIFWGIFNLGGVVGAAVSLGQNFHSEANAVGNGTYIGFLVLTLIGVTIPLLMADPHKMIRTDGTKVTTHRHPSWKVELYGLWVTLRTDPMVLLLFPMFFASNWFTTWQFNGYNAALFNIRARSMNNFAASKSLHRLGYFLFSVFATHIWAYFYQRDYTRESIPPDSSKMDIHDPAYPARIWLYIFFGALDAAWQTYAYWMMGAMSNDPAKLAHFAGFYKSIQSAGAAGVWRADGVKRPYMDLFLSTWVLLVAGLLFALPMIYMRVRDHTSIEDEALARMDDSGAVQATPVARHEKDTTAAQ